MTDYGILSKVVNAQNVKLKIGPTPDSEEAEGAQQEWITVYNISLRKAHPTSRVNTRGGAVDFYSHPLIEVPFEGLCSKDIYDKLDALSTLNARSALPVEDYTIVGENIGGSAADDPKAQFNATLPEFESLAGQHGQMAVRGVLRINNLTYPSGS